MKMLCGNFLHAMQIAVEERVKMEGRANFKCDSAFLAGLKDVAEAAERGEAIEIEAWRLTPQRTKV